MNALMLWSRIPVIVGGIAGLFRFFKTTVQTAQV